MIGVDVVVEELVAILGVVVVFDIVVFVVVVMVKSQVPLYSCS